MVRDGWPIVGGRERWRLGEVTVRWSAVDPGRATAGGTAVDAVDRTA
jgi:hypothetical protein